MHLIKKHTKKYRKDCPNPRVWDGIFRVVEDGAALMLFNSSSNLEMEIEIVRLGWTNFSNWTDRIKKLNWVPKKCS